MFKCLIKVDFSMTTDHNQPDCIASLTILEQIALRYVAGYVCRKVCKQAEKRNEDSSLEEEIRIAMVELAGDEQNEEAGTEEWTNSIDRGGLWHINVYSFFLTMEYEAKLMFRMSKNGPKANVGKQLLDVIRNNDDVKFKWWLLSSEMKAKFGMLLFSNITELYVTIRGFAFVSGSIELFKQSKLLSIQRRLPLEKN